MKNIRIVVGEFRRAERKVEVAITDKDWRAKKLNRLAGSMSRRRIFWTGRNEKFGVEMIATSDNERCGIGGRVQNDENCKY